MATLQELAKLTGGQVIGNSELEISGVSEIQNGVAGYAKGLDKAQADDRVKGNPLVIKGVATSGANKADVVIGNADVMKIQSANTTGGVLRDCRVLFVLD
mgnify:CR=1 FL=1